VADLLDNDPSFLTIDVDDLRWDINAHSGDTTVGRFQAPIACSQAQAAPDTGLTGRTEHTTTLQANLMTVLAMFSSDSAQRALQPASLFYARKWHLAPFGLGTGKTRVLARRARPAIHHTACAKEFDPLAPSSASVE